MIQADQLGHILMEPGEECYDAVIALFGKEIIKKDKTIDRRRISDVVFTDKDMLLKLNGIIHPAVKQRILRSSWRTEGSRKRVSALWRLLFFWKRITRNSAMKSGMCIQRRKSGSSRLMESRGYSREKSLGIIRNQVSDQVFREHTDYVIENNGDLKDTRRQIREGIERNETL